MVEYLIGIGENYLNSFIDFCADKIKDFLIGKIESLKFANEIDLEQYGKEFGNQLYSGFKEITKKENYKEDPIFKDFNQNEIKKMIMEIFEKRQNIDLKNDIENFKIAKIDKINILLLGDQDKDIDKFMGLISKMFDINKGKFKVEFQQNFIKALKVGLKRLNNKKNCNKIINCIWYFHKEPNKNIENKINYELPTTNNLCNEIPIINIYYKNKLSNDNIETFYRLNIRKEKFNYSKLFSNHIIESDNLNEKFILNLIEKTIINILIKNNEFVLEEKAINIKEISQKKYFCFGNKINNLSILDIQMLDYIFKKFLLANNIPNSIRKKYKNILHMYQEYLENHSKSYYSMLLSKNNDCLIIKYRNILKKLGEKMNKKIQDPDKDKEKLLYEIYSSIILFINELEFDFEDEDDNDSKKNSKNNGVLNNVISSFGDDIGMKLKILFDDFLMKKASNFINELVIDNIRDIIINNYNVKSRDFYIENHKKEEYVFEDYFEEDKK